MKTTATTDVMRWYVLDAEGTTITEVMVGGPYLTCEEAVTHYRTLSRKRAFTEVALLDSRKVSRHLDEENRLREWLLTRSCHNPFQ